VAALESMGSLMIMLEEASARLKMRTLMLTQTSLGMRDLKIVRRWLSLHSQSQHKFYPHCPQLALSHQQEPSQQAETPFLELR
jgi:hypothetical protein